MVRRLFCVLLIVALFAVMVAPCFAVDNTIGVIQEDLIFCGVAYDDASSGPTMFPTIDGVIKKRDAGSIYYLDLAGHTLYYFFRWPSITDSLNFTMFTTLATSNVSCSSSTLYGYVRESSTSGSLEELTSAGVTFYSNGDYGSARCTARRDVVNNSYSYLVVGFNFNSSAGLLIRSRYLMASSSGDTYFYIGGSDTSIYARGVAYYGDDGGLVDEVFSIGDDVEAIAGNMQTIVDDMQAKSDAADEIGGTTSEETITGTQETLSTGMAAINETTTLATEGMGGLIDATPSYFNFMSATVPVLLAFGDGDPLHFALVAVIGIAALAFLLKVIMR